MDKKIEFSEFPVVIWEDSYDDNPELLHPLIQHISDYMLFGFSSNQFQKQTDMQLIDIFEGNLAKLSTLYHEITNVFGAPGSTTIKDYKFFHKPYQRINGSLLKMPLMVTASNVSQSVVDEKIEKNSSMIAAMLRNKAANALSQEDGQDYSFMRNEEEYVPSTEDELLAQMNAPQQEEYAVTRILSNLLKRHDAAIPLSEANKDHFVLGRMFAYIDTEEKGEPRIVHVPASKFAFISPVPVYDMDDQNISAYGIKNYTSIENVLRKYGHMFTSSSNLKYLEKTISGIKNGKSIKYNTSSYAGSLYSSPYADPFGNETEVYMKELSGGIHNDGHYTPSFYQMSGGIGMGRCSILEHKIFFKVLKKRRAKLTIDGKNPTQDVYKRFQANPSAYKYRFIPVDKSYKAKDGEMIVYRPYEELYKATRIGHCMFIDVGKYEYQTHYEKKTNVILPPAIGFISKEPSIVAIGKELSVFYNSFMYKAQELRNLAGPDDILLLDEVQMDRAQWASSLHSGAKTGTMWYNSSKVQDQSNRDAGKHLTRVQLTPKVESILKYFEACQAIESIFEKMIGPASDPSPYDSAQKVNQMIENGSLLTQHYFYEDYIFRKKSVQRLADISKQFYARDGYLSLTWGKGASEVINLTEKMGMFDYEVYLETGIKAIEDRQYVMAKAEAAVSSGALGFIDAMQLYFSDNIQESVAKIKAAMAEMAKSRDENVQMQSQVAAEANKISQEKNMVPIEVKKIDADTARYVADLRYKSQQDSIEFKQDAADISQQSDREKAILDAQLDRELEDNSSENEIIKEVSKSKKSD